MKIQNLPLSMDRTSSKSFSESLKLDTETQGTVSSLFFIFCLMFIVYSNVRENFITTSPKVKVIRQQAWTGPRGSGSVKAPDFLDFRHYEGGRLSAIRTGPSLPQEKSLVLIFQRLSRPQGTGFRESIPGLSN